MEVALSPRAAVSPGEVPWLWVCVVDLGSGIGELGSAENQVVRSLKYASARLLLGEVAEPTEFSRRTHRRSHGDVVAPSSLGRRIHRGRVAIVLVVNDEIAQDAEA